ncbi:hypothetical protein DENIS_3207 [Desulfonema ishimotonii]|uniref:HAD family hydrolase n=1 Tax=Desulfonema ishimotonii TaxID=45657 RepID=A0A401FZ44_9BACT|nr:HAD-IA family hydrolase [Desulfonema ishimotonii]GBC62238.1 hypothetical protein DENIS_3207 [Desulfonema ishimotonii]
MKHTSIKAVLFDFDGTLTRPGAIKFPIIKERLGCPSDRPVLEFIREMPDPEDRRSAHAALEQFEADAAIASRPNAGAVEIITYLRSKGVRLGILTRNLEASVARALENFNGVSAADFELILSREAPIAPKPSPAGVLLAAQELGVEAGELMVVGDFGFDIEAGNQAGATTVFLTNGTDDQPPPPDADYRISDLSQLRDIVRLGLPLPAGKFPNDLLRKFLDGFEFKDPSVIVNPGIGEDTAAVSVRDEEVIVLKSDPITFATDAIGQYAVLINANDIATAGATPRWLLTTLLFPCGTTPAEAFQVMNDLEQVCRRWHITLCGGHTEITDAVTRTVVSGMLTGVVPRDGLIDKRNMRPGDKILMTKGVAVEGTTIIAREFGERLASLGMAESEIAHCRQLLSQISILDEARIAAQSGAVSAMHDVTEGGLASAFRELGVAGGHRLRVHMENIPVFPQTRTMCELLELHPLGLIGSGSLLICCREAHCKQLIADIFRAGVQVTYIGEVLEAGEGIEALREGQPAEWPEFEVDEIARLFGTDAEGCP